MLRILIDARMYGLENSGIGRYLINLLDNLQDVDKKNEYIILLRKKYFDTLTFKSGWKKILADYKHYSLREQLYLPSILNKESPDLVHFPHLNIPYFWKGNFMATVHDLTMQRQGASASLLPIPVYLIKRLGFLLVARKCVREAKVVISPTHVVKDDVCKFYGISKDKVKVVFEGVGEHFRKLGAGKALKISSPYFVYVGNAYPHKNIPMLIEAIVLLNKNLRRKVSLVLGGSRSVFVTKLKSEIKKHKAEGLVKIVGYIKDEDLRGVYKNSLSFVYPSLAEGFGLQGVEAMTSGTLVLASDIPVFREVYEDHAIYFNPNDVNSLVGAMREVVNMNTKRRTEKIVKSIDFARKYSWRETAKRTVDVYEGFK